MAICAACGLAENAARRFCGEASGSTLKRHFARRFVGFEFCIMRQLLSGTCDVALPTERRRRSRSPRSQNRNLLTPGRGNDLGRHLRHLAFWLSYAPFVEATSSPKDQGCHRRNQSHPDLTASFVSALRCLREVRRTALPISHPKENCEHEWLLQLWNPLLLVRYARSPPQTQSELR